MEIEYKPEPIKAENEAGYIKLMKSETSKGVVYYAWDIKVVEGKDPNEVQKLIKLIEEINDQLSTSFVNSQ